LGNVILSNSDDIFKTTIVIELDTHVLAFDGFYVDSLSKTFIITPFYNSIMQSAADSNYPDCHNPCLSVYKMQPTLDAIHISAELSLTSLM
jgi:hypothetical protein